MSVELSPATGSGDALKLGIGAMTTARVQDFYDRMVKAGIVKANLDYKKAYTLRFVNKGVGLGLRPKRSDARAQSLDVRCGRPIGLPMRDRQNHASEQF